MKPIQVHVGFRAITVASTRPIMAELLQKVCIQKYPAYSVGLQSAYTAWLDKNEPTIAEITRSKRAMLTLLAEIDGVSYEEQLRRFDYGLGKPFLDQFESSYARNPEVFERTCREYNSAFLADARIADLSTSLAEDMAVLKDTPWPVIREYIVKMNSR